MVRTFSRFINSHLTLILICISLTSACKTQSTVATNLEQTASNELGPDYTIDYNTSKSFALCKQRRVNDHVNSIFNYCVINTRENKVVHKGSYQQGSVRWIDNDNIEVTTTNKFSTEPTKNIISINSSQQ